MCRETELEWYLGGADLDDTLVSLQPRTTGKELEGARSPEPPNVLGGTVEEQERVVNEREVVRSIFPTRRTSSAAQPPRLLPYFPKHGVTSPPPPQSLARNADLVAATQSPPPSKASARNPSPLPAQRASANSPVVSSKKSARNPSPVPASRTTSRNQTSEVSKPTSTSNSSPAIASRANARNPSPTPAPRTSAARNPSPTPATRAPGRNPSPTPAPTTSSGRNPSPSPASRVNQVVSSGKTPPAPSSNGKTVTSSRRPASPALTRREPSRPLYDDNGRRICTPDSARKPTSTMGSSPASSLDSSGDLSPRSALDVNKALRMSINRSLKKEGLGAWSPESPTCPPVKKLTPLELQAQKKERIAGYGRKAGSGPKSGRVACEGMLPSSPVKTDIRKRCHWVTPQSEPGLVAYHDEVWGVPVHDDKVLFELLVLEGAQAELSRPQILSMRAYFREVFGGFDPKIVSKFDEKKVAALKADEIIRQPEAKLRGVIDNAKQLLKVVEEFGSFDRYLWNFVGFKPIVNTNRIFTQIPVKSSKSETLSKDLMRRGFRYVGPTTVYSFMQAAGMVNDHLVSCYRHGECSEISHLVSCYKYGECSEISQMQATDNSKSGDKKGC